MMKNSIFKKIVSAIAVMAMLITSTATVFAANEYVSVTSPCDGSKTGWLMSRSSSSYDRHSASAKKVTFLTPGEANGQIPSDGPFGMYRQIFKTNKANAALYGLDESKAESDGSIWYHANGNKWEAIDMTDVPYGADGNYFFQYSTGGNNATYATESGITTAPKFTTGVIQAKFDFAFGGDADQCISVGFSDRRATVSGAGFLGARIYRNNIRFWWPNKDAMSAAIYFDEEKTKLGCGTSDYTDAPWYTAVLSYNMDAKVISLSIKSRDDNSFSFTRSYSVKDTNTNTYIGSYFADGVNNVAFGSFRGIDQSVVSTTPSPASSKWYIDNVSLDACSETNYAVGSIYRDDAGLESNKKFDGAAFKGYALERFTNIVDPADAKFITAAYDSEGRMEDVLATPLSAIGTTPVHGAVAGDTVKSFILGMNTATPYMSAYEYADPETTVRKLDFEEGYVAQGAGNGASITKVAEGDNNIIRIERTGFGSSYHMTYTDNGWENVYETKKSPDAMWQYLDLGETVTSYEASFKLKFAGHNNPAGYQSCQFNIGAKDSPALIQRKSDGSVSVSTDYDGGKDNIFVLGDNEWCEVNIKVTFGDSFVNSSSKTVSNTQIEWTFKKNGTVVGAFLQNVDRQDLSAGTSKVYIGSRRDNDTIGLSSTVDTTNYKTTSSVWYIDDFTVKY